jgi:hypothetical protein
MGIQDMSPPIDPAPPGIDESESVEETPAQKGSSNNLLWIVAVVLLLGVVSILGYLLWLYYGV